MTEQRHEELQPLQAFPFARVVVATDGGPASRHAIAWARACARHGSRVWVIHVMPSPLVGSAAYGWTLPALTMAEERRILSDATRELESRDEDGLMGYGDPAREIVRLADDVRADLIIVGTHGRSASERLLLGSVADEVRRKSKRSILLARSPPAQKILLAASDGSANAARAHDVAKSLAREWSARVELCRVDEGDAADGIIGAAKRLGAELIVMGARGMGRIRSALMGSVSTKVCHAAETSVLVVRGERP